MTQSTPGSTSNLFETAKSTLLKTIFLSFSILALGAAPAHADESNTRWLFSFDGIGDAVISPGQLVPSDVYPEIQPVEGTGWESEFDTRYIAKCVISEKDTCDVKTVGNKVPLTVPQLQFIIRELFNHSFDEKWKDVDKTRSTDFDGISGQSIEDCIKDPVLCKIVTPPGVPKNPILPNLPISNLPISDGFNAGLIDAIKKGHDSITQQ